MGTLKYLNREEFDKRFYMFAKANITRDFSLINKTHYHELFIHSFKNKTIPDFIGVVPLIKVLSFAPTKTQLDIIYEAYSNKVQRDIEGIVVNYQNNISKYVRMKGGILQEHRDIF